MSNSFKFTVPAAKPRNPLAMDAKTRHAGAMHDRRMPRGGASNWRDMVEEDLIEMQEEEKQTREIN
jgi:hypothetical protein